MRDDKTPNQATGESAADEGMRINLADYRFRSLKIAFINSGSQERVNIEVRYEEDGGAMLDLWVRDEQGRCHTYFNACLLD